MTASRHSSGAAIGVIAAVALVSGCFYTGGVNSRPKAEIRETSVGPYNNTDTVTFTASKSEDQDGEVLRAEWWVVECTDDAGQVCPTSGAEQKQTLSPNETYTVQLKSKRPLRIVLRVTDPRGAIDEDSEVILVQNRAPTGSLQVQGSTTPQGAYPLGTAVDLLLTKSDPDGDAVAATWSFEPPSNSVPGDVSFMRTSDTHYILDPDVQGVWTINVELDDGDETVVVTKTILFQADTPPCVGTTDPLAVPDGRYILESDGEQRRFSVLSVTDDLDVFPAPSPNDPILGTATFRWYLATPDTAGSFVELSGHEESDYLFDPSAYAPGDLISIRVEIDDRKLRTLPCDPALPTCSLTGDACLQRVTWGVEVR